MSDQPELQPEVANDEVIELGSSLLRSRLREDEYTIPGTSVVWKLHALTGSEEAACIGEAMNDGGFVVLPKLQRARVRIGLRGWSGLQDDAQPPAAVAFETERAIFDGAVVNVVKAAILNMMPAGLVEVLSARIWKISQLEPAEKKG